MSVGLNRRELLKSVAGVLASQAVPVNAMAALAKQEHDLKAPTFPLALAGLLRHKNPEEIRPDLARFHSKGYNGIWIENDYVRWKSKADDPDQGFGGCWRLFNIFDFTFSDSRAFYRGYLKQIDKMCAENDLEIWASFWVPLPNVEMMSYLRQNRPKAIGQSTWDGKPVPTLCTCEAGGGLPFLTAMFESFLDQFPQVAGLKIATGDNGALICDTTCPNAHGTTQAQHAGNMFGVIDETVHSRKRKARLMLYPWFWGEGWREQILTRLQGDYLVMTKMEENSHQTLEPGVEGDPIFDDSIVTEQPGPDFVDWCKRFGAERIIDMLPVGSGPDDWFFNFPPYPGRLLRRLRKLRSLGVNKFLDYECGGHAAGSNEEAVSVFAGNPKISEADLLKEVARRLYRWPEAQNAAIEGWRYFDEGFGRLPIGLGGTNSAQFSGRFGFAWPMCLATPLVPEAFAHKDRWHEIFWFSPYNFFTPENAPRIQVHFRHLMERWEHSLDRMALADGIESSEASRREYVAVLAHVFGMNSVLNWCSAAVLAEEKPFPKGTWQVLLADELKLTEAFQELRKQYPWIWANNCWHPEETPLHQKGIGFSADDDDPFEAKIRILKKSLNNS